MKEEVEEASRAGDTVNGVFEVVAHGVPAGLGTYANWDERLDGLLAWAVMSLQAVKAVEIGRGVAAAAIVWLARARSDPLCCGESARQADALYAPAQQRRRHRGRRFERRRHCGARLSEADFDAAPAAGVGAL